MNKKIKKPLVSVVMPVKDAGNFLVESIESVINQTVNSWEMIVVNDGSRDETAAILSKFARKDKRIRIIDHARSRGIAKSLNEAIKLTRGKYVARMDGDDVSYPARFADQVEYLEKHRKVVAVGGQVVMIDGESQEFAEKWFSTDKNKLREMIMWMVPIQHPAMMVRGEVFRKVRYDERLTTAEDVELFMQLLSHGELGNVRVPVLKYRKADTSNGYHDVKKTFWYTVWGRMLGIIKHGYRPSLKGIMLCVLQVLMVGLLPSKLVVRLYESKRFVWLVKEYLGRIIPAQNE